ncbi:hypothetical protein [Roseibacillus persicicus]|uniref:hypothetical protein n=1 Tax=Roseibacillus persicicus TaxID=454148 RepID=UPI00280C4017|nr:hypothetical protein [Roseibacillus persicicus]MDQ8192713.1 hypothetical protein [Roseibacillus persicicus]
MTVVPSQVIEHYKESKSLVSVTRDEIDDQTLQGFVLDYDDQWILLGYIYDFTPDGVVAIRLSDLTSMTCRATDAFQRHLLEVDGVLDKVDFALTLPEGGFLDFLRRIPNEKVVILEDEAEGNDIFIIGQNLQVLEDKFTLRTFSGAARVEDDLGEIDLDDVTSISLNTNYALAYERHFARIRMQNKAQHHKSDRAGESEA